MYNLGGIFINNDLRRERCVVTNYYLPINCFHMTGELEAVTNPRDEIQVSYDANDAHLGYERVSGEGKRIYTENHFAGTYIYHCVDRRLR